MSSTIILKSSDSNTFHVDEAVALQIDTIKVLKGDSKASEFDVLNVTSSILAKVIEYCKKHVANEENLKEWDAEFLWEVDKATLLDLVQAADYLKIQSLLNLTCQTVANMIYMKKPEETENIFNIRNNFTSEEVNKIRTEIKWAFE